jgi:transmembrane secretion effector
MVVSLVGDGAFLVALAWQVYELSGAATAMATIGIAMTVPTIAFLLIGGVVSDRRDRRRILLAADLARAVVVGALAVLSLTGALELWHVAALVAVYGVGVAFFAPAFDAIVPDLLPQGELAQANAIDQLVRPLALRMAGPAIGGLAVAAIGAGATFALDAASFTVSAAALAFVRAPRRGPEAPGRSAVADLREGWTFVRGRVWLWGTFVSAALAYLLFMGPVEVLVPLVVKNTLHGSAADLGWVFAAGGLGSVLCAVVVGSRSLPRRAVTFIYVTWTGATLVVAGYGVASEVWQLMVAAAAFNALETAGTIVWATIKQRHVPADMLGRVSSLDWIISIGLLPLSFALTGPAEALIGAQATLVAAGVLGAAVTLGGLALPGMRALERDGRRRDGGRSARRRAPDPQPEASRRPALGSPR